MKIEQMLMLISDHGNVLAAKMVNGIGAVSIGSGLTIGAVSVSVAPQEAWSSSLPVIAACVSIFGGLTFIAKNLFDMYLAYKKSTDDKLTPKD